MREIKYIVIHCTGGPQNQKLSDIQAFWAKKGWKRPGYHFMYKPDGEEIELLPVSEVANGVQNFNKDSIHLSYFGGVGPNGEIMDNRTPGQKESMEKRVRKLHISFSKAIIQGHRDFSPDKNRDGVITPDEWMKACPSFSVRQWLKEIGLFENPIITDVKKAVSTIRGGNVNIRNGAGFQHKIIGTVPTGRIAVVRYTVDQWSFVEFSGTLMGWVKSEFLK